MISIPALWDKATGLSLKAHGGIIETLSVSAFTFKALRIQSSSSIASTKDRIVCIHGLGSSGSAYGNLLPHLKEYWSDVWAPSAPSHGQSPPIPPSIFEDRQQDNLNNRELFQSIIYEAWEACLLSLSETSPIDLLGVSLGGAIAIRFSARYPKRVSSLMLCSPAGAVLDTEDIEHLKSVFRMSRPGDGLRFLKTLYHKVPWWGPVLAPFVRLSLSRPEAQDLIQSLEPGDGIHANEFRELSMPVLLIWGARERVLPDSILKKLIDHAPKDFTLMRPEYFSHTPQKEDPMSLMSLLKNFQVTLKQDQ